jgi:hypothetical protein
MNSSTSSSDPRPRLGVALRIAASLVAVLLLLELFTRAVLLPQSRDYVRFDAYPGQAAELSAYSGLRLAFLGNSATQRGIEPDLFVQSLANPGREPVHVGFFLADASEIHTWYFLAKHLFWNEGRKPDWTIVTFFGGLDDAQNIDIGRLAYAFTTPGDWPEVFDADLTRFSGRSEYLLSSYWATYATRDRFRSRVLRLVPGYAEYLEQANALQYRQMKKGPAAPKSYRALERFLEQAKAHGTKLCFVAFPMIDARGRCSYNIDSEARARIRDSGMALLDLREVPGLSAKHYEDDIHLLPAGAEIYTRHFAKAFNDFLKEQAALDTAQARAAAAK